jgi:hypothetical protein
MSRDYKPREIVLPLYSAGGIRTLPNQYSTFLGEQTGPFRRVTRLRIGSYQMIMTVAAFVGLRQRNALLVARGS